MRRNNDYIYEIIEIKILILFILRRLPEPVSLDELIELTMCDEGISYFDVVESIVDLVRTGHVQQKDDMYSITEKGVQNSKITEKGMPLSIRAQSDKVAFEKRSRQIRNAMIETFHTMNSDGNYEVMLSMSDGVGKIFSMDMFAVNEQQALSLESGFRKKAEAIYNTLIGMILK